MLHLGAVDTVDSDSDEERITYAASEHDCSERGSDSGPSVLEELPCEIRGSPGRGDILLFCDSCNDGTHTTYLKPALLSVPKGVRLCPNCDNNTETATEATNC